MYSVWCVYLKRVQGPVLQSKLGIPSIVLLSVFTYLNIRNQDKLTKADKNYNMSQI